jgi:prepilin-type N-terminal cleavage/methylation domain-containing protein/prepilin-type processing-associated H-X9-DG protein
LIMISLPHKAIHLQRSRGLTLVEVLIVIAIVATLITFLIPAVMDSRRAAERLQCANHLRQVELATIAYHDLFNQYPAYFVSGRSSLGQASKYYSVFARIAPQLELVAIYNNINFQVDLLDSVTVGQSSKSDLSFQSPANTTVMNMSVPVFFCPSNPTTVGQAVCQGTNYRANYGSEPGYGSNLNLSGPFTYWNSTSAANVTDGLSLTAAYSEKPRGDAQRMSFDPFIDPLVDPSRPDPPATVLFEYCARQPIFPENYRTTTGINWLVGGLTQTCYNHMEVPNGKIPDCLMSNHFPGIARSTARSYHAAGANVAMADGSVRFVTATIQIKTWIALGTRAGAEVIPNDW